MSRFVTVDRQSADCKKYLSGHFSSSEVALPVPLLEGPQRNSSITFQILNDIEIKKPNILVLILKLFRLDLVVFTIIPALVVWMYCFEIVSIGEEWALIASVFFLHGATFAFNDYFDHMQGRDHVNEKSGSRLIQNGYLRAYQVLRIAWLFWGLALVGGLYLAYFNPGILVFAAVGAALGALGSMYQFFGLKSIGFSDLALFFALGPLLALGTQYTLTKNITFPILVVGVIYGLLALVYSQAKNLSTTLLDHQAGIRTISVRLGFDKAKSYLMFELSSTILLSLYAFRENYWFVPVFAVFVSFAVYKLNQVKSPVSGLAQEFPVHVLRLHNIFSIFCLIDWLILRNQF